MEGLQFQLIWTKEKTKFMQRFTIYKELGNIKIFSHAKPEIIAEQMKKEITFYNK